MFRHTKVGRTAELLTICRRRDVDKADRGSFPPRWCASVGIDQIRAGCSAGTQLPLVLLVVVHQEVAQPVIRYNGYTAFRGAARLPEQPVSFLVEAEIRTADIRSTVTVVQAMPDPANPAGSR